MRKFPVFTLFLLFFPILSPAQVTIVGEATGYEGEEIKISGYHDLFTFTTHPLDSTTVDSNGQFQLKTPTIKKGLYVFEIGNKVFSHVFLKNGERYLVNIPQPEKLRTEMAQDIFVQPEITETGSLNKDIEDLELRVYQFITDNVLYFESRLIRPMADSAVTAITDSFADMQDDYFKEYLHYRMAELEVITGHSVREVFEKYFQGRKPSYYQLSFANAFKQLFQGYLKPHNVRSNAEDIKNAINAGNYSDLDNALKKDPLLADDQFRQLLLVTGLYELGVKKSYNKDLILPLLDSLSQNAITKEHRAIAESAKGLLNHLSVGTPAPDFTFQDHLGNPHRLSDYRGAQVYLNIIRDWNLQTSEEISLMKVLKKGYGQDIAFLTIYIGKDPAQLKSRMRELKMDWVVGAANQHEVERKYGLRAFPSYFFIDKSGNLKMSPAPPPGASIEREFSREYHKSHAEQNKLFKLQPPEVEEEPRK